MIVISGTPYVNRSADAVAVAGLGALHAILDPGRCRGIVAAWSAAWMSIWRSIVTPDLEGLEHAFREGDGPPGTLNLSGLDGEVPRPFGTITSVCLHGSTCASAGSGPRPCRAEGAWYA